MNKPASLLRRTSDRPATPVRTALQQLANESIDSELCLIELEAPVSPAEALVDLEATGPLSYWADPSGYEQVSIGALRVLSASGSERFGAITEQARTVFASLGEFAPRIRLFGGFAFQSDRVPQGAWEVFGEARFVLPRLSFERRGDKARLVLLLSRAELSNPETRESVSELAERAWAMLDQRGDPDGEMTRAALLPANLEERPESEFLQLVEQARNAIDAGELEKVVLARRVGVRLGNALRTPQVLRRLGAIAPECIRFAFRVKDATFVGATPERLVTKLGSEFETEAVAGSVAASDAPTGRLLESSKNRAEQAIVVRELLSELGALASSIQHSKEPEIHRLRHVAHLRTKISGRLREPLHVLELVERLHPTPAVGGVPRARATTWIAQNEPDERGWYSGPIGWMDSEGDGAFAVALRSGLLDKQSAAVYAGAGIVVDSDPSSEFAETRWKLAALLGALGVSP